MPSGFVHRSLLIPTQALSGPDHEPVLQDGLRPRSATSLLHDELLHDQDPFMAQHREGVVPHIVQREGIVLRSADRACGAGQGALHG